MNRGISIEKPPENPYPTPPPKHNKDCPLNSSKEPQSL